MRVHVSGKGFEVTDVLRTYAESRVWLAVHRDSSEMSWVGVGLMSEDVQAVDGRVVCQLDVWLRGIGLVTVRHIDVNPYLAIDCAAVRLEQALDRKLRETARHARAANHRPVAMRTSRATPGRYAVLIVPSDAWPRQSLSPWLKMRHDIQQVQTISLGWSEWDALVAGELDSPHLKRLKGRLALAQLSRPDAIVVMGRADPQVSWDEPSPARCQVQQVVNNVRSLAPPIEVIGVWINEHWMSEDSLIESQKLPTCTERASDSNEELYAGLTSD